MAQLTEIKLPDIGDFKDVPVIELLVKPGDAVEKETSLITLETDKATMEVPAPQAGVVKDLHVKIGDKVSEGSLILTLEKADGPDAAKPAESAETLKSSGAMEGTATLGAVPPDEEAGKKAEPESFSGPATTVKHASPSSDINADIHADIVVLGAGPGGYTAAFRAADLGKKVVLIERHPTLGGVCLNVGCIPSKALLHIAKVITDSEEAARQGIDFAKPGIELEKLRRWKESVVGKLTRGLAVLAKQRKVTVVQGKGRFN